VVVSALLLLVLLHIFEELLTRNAHPRVSEQLCRCWPPAWFLAKTLTKKVEESVGRRYDLQTTAIVTHAALVVEYTR
jgi:hypothetical protein